MSASTVIRIPAKHLRKLPDPQSSGGTEEIVYFPARVIDLPVKELSKWKDVNPRDVKTKTAVYAKIFDTLMVEPDKFYRRNRGITISADDLRYDSKTQIAEIVFKNNTLHGVIDGAHSLHAAGAAQENDVSEEAFVQMKVILGLTKVEEVVEVAGGLNTSMAVDLTSLENLEGNFQPLKDEIAKESYAGKIAYKMNEQNNITKPVDVREILYYLALFDGKAWGPSTHPVALFGRKEGIVREFAKEAAGQPSAYSFKILFKAAKDILRLRDMLEKELIQPKYHLGKLKARNAKGETTKVRVERKHLLVFLNEEVNDELALGYLMPMLGAFRANVEWDTQKGTFKWKVPLEKVVPLCARPLADAIMAVHDSEKRPEYVGRSALAWLICYNAVESAIRGFQLSKKI